MRTVARLSVMLLALTAPVGCSASAQAQGYPTRPIRMVVPYPAGGPTDIVARIYAQKLSEALGQPVIIDNKAGATGQIGAQDVARAVPDGHTLLANASSAVIIPHVYTTPLYDIERDFTAVSLLASVPTVLVVPASSKAQSVQDLVADFKLRGRVNYASSSAGGAMHLAAERFRQITGLDMQHIAYKGGGPSMNAVVIGEVAMSFESLPAVLPHIKGGQVKALAMSAAQRNPALPDVPTMIEQGFPAFDYGSWYAVWAPAKTPPEIVKRLNAELSRIAALPEIKAKFESLGTDVEAMSVEAFAAFQRKEDARWGAIARSAAIKLD